MFGFSIVKPPFSFTDIKTITILPLKMVRRLEPNLLRCDVVCVFKFVYTLPLRRNSEVKNMSSDSEPNSFADLSRITDENIMEEDQEDVEESLTHKLTSRVDVT